MTTYLQPTQEAAVGLLRRGIEGPVVMLNLLRLREMADFSATPDLAPQPPMSGAEAFDRYMSETLPHLQASGGDLMFVGAGGPWFIGPEDAGWDVAMLVRQSSVERFLSFAEDPEILSALAYRTAAVSDSRLLPLAPRDTLAWER